MSAAAFAGVVIIALVVLAAVTAAIVQWRRYTRAPTIEILCVVAAEDETLAGELEERLARAASPRLRIRRFKADAGEMKDAALILLMISVDFFASDTCDAAMNAALGRARRGESRVIPVLLRHCAWTETDVAKLQVLPKSCVPVTDKRSRREVALEEVAREIKSAAAILAARARDPALAASRTI